MALKRKASSTGFSRRVKPRKQTRPIRRYRRIKTYRARSRRAYRSKVRRFARKLTPIAETKLTPCTGLVEDTPHATGALSQTYYHALAGGLVKPTQWSGTWQMVGGYDVVRGSGNNQLDGAYAYLKKTYIDYEVVAQKSTSPAEFNTYRTIIGKVRRSANPTGISRDVGQHLFLDQDGTSFGHLTSGKTGLDFIKQPINKRDFVVLKDSKYSLSPVYAWENGVLQNNQAHFKYPVKKLFRLNINFFRKSHYPDMGLGQHVEPNDVDMHWFIITVASHHSRDNHANDWEVNFRGTTMWCDV